MGVKAVISQTAPNHPPTMGEGDVDPSLLWDWFTKCEIFLRHKNISGSDMVKTVAYGMSGVRAIRWLAAKGPVLDSIDWDEYKLQMRSLFLPSDWEHSTRMDILRYRQPTSKPFIDFAFELMGKNNLLAGTDSFMNDDFMRETIEAGMEQELSCECNREGTNQIVEFQAWLDEVKRLDERRRACLKEVARKFAKLSVRQAPATRTPLSRTGAAPSNTTSSTRSSTPMPKLTDVEHQLLQDNGGCFQCRKFWAGHIGACCTAPPLDGASYKPLTAASVLPRPTTFAARGSSSRSTVAALLAAQADASPADTSAPDVPGPA
ncbi:hypothetical protein EYR40_004524 [Pleurotus pulmonarius]|nr:hypothetical protein EYR40_004524 [Pleurotus pulmonarius]